MLYHNDQQATVSYHEPRKLWGIAYVCVCVRLCMCINDSVQKQVYVNAHMHDKYDIAITGVSPAR